jgi:hypothetical protein
MIDEMKRLEVSLLGRFEVRVDDEPVPASGWTHGRARDLVKLLALAPGGDTDLLPARERPGRGAVDGGA